jgi:pimeloyl-ACP methyl ester carboxylesterase
MPFLTITGHRIDYETIPGTRPGAPPLLLLHEGLGSIAMWRDFPTKLAAATGCAVTVYSRYGYGRSSAIDAPRTVQYMHGEALDALPELRAALGIEAPILMGHSDGASISLIHAGAARWPVKAVIVEAPHVFVEDVSVKSIAGAKIAYETTDLRVRLGRYHEDVDGVFRGWNDIWLAPDFRAWNIEEYLPAIACPVLAIQGADDEYGTLAQIDAIEAQVGGPFEKLVLPPRCGHSPHRTQEAATIAAVSAFIERL